MPAHTELSARLLNEAAGFFRALGLRNPPIAEQMDQNAAIFEQVAGLLVKDPKGRVGDRTYTEMGAKLLRDAAALFMSLADGTDPARKQMAQNAAVYEKMAARLEKDPAGSLG